jgi:hypothetical protein
LTVKFYKESRQAHTELRKLRQKEKTFKVADRDGMSVTVAAAGTKSFRYDYRLNGQRETLTIGLYEDTAGAKHPRVEGDDDSPEPGEVGWAVCVGQMTAVRGWPAAIKA